MNYMLYSVALHLETSDFYYIYIPRQTKEYFPRVQRRRIPKYFAASPTPSQATDNEEMMIHSHISCQCIDSSH
jgi:hypothetical protein